MCGTAKYLKEQNANVVTVGIDTYGSVFKKYHETGEFDEKEIYPYITEGIAEDILPKNVDFSLIDKFEKVTDKDGALATRASVHHRLAQRHLVRLRRWQLPFDHWQVFVVGAKRHQGSAKPARSRG